MSPLTLASPLGLVAIAELAGFVRTWSSLSVTPQKLLGSLKHTGGGARGDNGTVEAGLGDDVNLDGGIAARIVDGARVDLGNGHGCDVCRSVMQKEKGSVGEGRE